MQYIIRPLHIFLFLGIILFGIHSLRPVDTAFAQGCPTSCPDQCYESSNPGENYYIDGPTDFCMYQSGCTSSLAYAWQNCCRTDISPIIIDVDRSGYQLSSADDGVFFKLLPQHKKKYKISWPTSGSSNAWLVLDVNNNGSIDDMTELFGNLTPQSGPFASRNGYKALAFYDQVLQGGNADGKITRHDAFWSRLRLWQDSNRDGISTPDELKRLDEYSLTEIGLTHQESRRTDEHGNAFRFRSRLRWLPGIGGSPWSWDVFLVIAGS